MVKIGLCFGMVWGLLLIASVCWAQTETLLTNPKFQENVIASPTDPAQWEAFQKDLVTWRAEIRKKLNYSDAFYQNPRTAWSATAFSCGFIMLNDAVIYDKNTDQFTPDKFLKEYAPQFGGFDCLVLWQAYPRIGIDDRNQFDFYRDQPGGLEGLKALIETFHKNGVRVMLAYSPWDTGTRREKETDAAVLAACVKATGADGVYLDTMDKGTPEMHAALDKLDGGVVFDSEGSTPLDALANHQNSWGQWFKDSDVPGVIRAKWVEPRHMVRIVERWDRDHSDEIAMAWMNGAGMVVWENVFGTWVGWNEFDKSLLRGMLPIQRQFKNLFTGEHLTPCYKTEMPGVYANHWQDAGVELYTLTNRSMEECRGRLLAVPNKGYRYFDLFTGEELSLKGSEYVTLSGTIPGRGIGGFVGVEKVDDALLAFLAGQKAGAAKFKLSREFPAHQVQVLVPKATSKYESAKLPVGMIELQASMHNQARQFRVRECGFYEAQTDILQATPMLDSVITLDVRSQVPHYAIDKTPVTNAEFKVFMDASKYKPLHGENFLKHWINGAPPAALADHPVVYVSLDDARAYAAWAGKRLPTEEEWQWAAVGQHFTGYPFGGKLIPDYYNDGSTKTTTSVNAFPKGVATSGCLDMCGNVFQWTESERTDGRIRYCFIKGGSFYKSRGSKWYADNGILPGHFSVKFLLGNPGLDRSATIGFRCVVDVKD